MLKYVKSDHTIYWIVFLCCMQSYLVKRIWS